MLMSECFIDVSERELLADLHIKLIPFLDYLSVAPQKGVYGDVQRVKILYNKKDSALIQMADGNQSQLGKRGLLVTYTYKF